MFYEDKAVIENNETESSSMYDTVVSPFFWHLWFVRLTPLHKYGNSLYLDKS